MHADHRLVLGLNDRRHALTRVLLLIEGRGFAVHDVRFRQGDTELQLSGPCDRLDHLLGRLRQTSGVLTAELVAGEPGQRDPDVVVTELRVHTRGGEGEPGLTDVTVVVSVDGHGVRAAADAADPLVAVADAVRAALRSARGVAADDLVVGDWSVQHDEHGTLVQVVAVGPAGTFRGAGRSPNLLTAAAAAVATAFAPALPVQPLARSA